MNKHLQYAKYVFRHKWFVWQECRKYGLYWRGTVHDLSKFSPTEWFPYVNHFYGTVEEKYESLSAYDRAWNNHQKVNKHHWQYWVLLRDSGGNLAMPIPDKYRKEMLADWRGAGRAISGKDDTVNWYLANKSHMILHDETRAWVELELGLIKIGG